MAFRFPRRTDTLDSIRPAVEFVIRGQRRTLALMAAVSFVGGVAEALFLITATRAAFAITDGSERIGIVAGRYLSVGGALGLAVALVVVRVACAVLAGWQAAALASTVLARIRHQVARAFLRASWSVQQKQRGGSLQELLSGYSGQASNLMSGVNQGMVAVANLVALLGLAVAVDPLGALVLVGSVTVLGSLLRPLRRAVRRRSRRHADAGMDLATMVNDISALGLEIHVFNVQVQAADEVSTQIERARERYRSLVFVSGLSIPAYVGLAYLSVIGALGLVALSDRTTLASLGAAMLVMLRSLSYGQALQTAYVSLSSSAPVIDELMAQLAVMEAGHQHDRGDPVGSVGVLAADHVTFAYVHGQDVLRDVTFEIQRQEIVGIVGPSGGGKSTLVQLLLGLRVPDSGQILADGRDIRSLDPAQWARRVTFVPQEPHLLVGTIAQNIRFLRPGVTDEEVEAAARLAHLHEEIHAHPEGYGRVVGAMGGDISGGQRQRLCIARALVEHPDVLILDEPTSALDVRSEHLIRATLAELRERMTVVVIAHRLSTLDICDRLMVIQDGQLVAFDDPAVLERSSDFYREALQLSGLR